MGVCGSLSLLQLDGKGLRLRDVDVRGDSTAALLEADTPHPVRLRS